MNNFFDEGFCVSWNQIGKQYEEGQSSSHTMSASEYETRLAEYNLQLIADTLDISRQQSEERVKESLKKAFDLSDNIFHMRQGIRKKYLEYEFRYVQQLRSHFPDSLSGVRSENDEEYTRILILYQLVLGNISLCLNEICLEYFIYDEADKWFQLALDAFWQAKGLNYGLEDKLHEDEEIYVYKYLIMLNIGKCYHNYAMQHQKSDYYAAQERFDQIISETQDQKGQLCRIMRRENDRRLKLIIMDAYAFELRIKRQERSFYQDCDSVKANERHQSYKDYEEKLEMMRKYCDKHFLNDSNRYKQYTAQISIEEVIINRKRRCFDAALEKAVVVEEERNQDFPFAGEAPPHNTDAINNISSVFRGIISSGDQPDLHIQSLNITYSIDCYPDRKPKNETDPTEICYFYKKEKGRAPLQSKLIALLRMLAREGNMYALREYVHWYGQYLKKPTEAAKLILLGDSFCTERPEVNALRTLTTSDAITRLGRGLDYILKNDEAVYGEVILYFNHTIKNRSYDSKTMLIVAALVKLSYTEKTLMYKFLMMLEQYFLYAKKELMFDVRKYVNTCVHIAADRGVDTWLTQEEKGYLTNLAALPADTAEPLVSPFDFCWACLHGIRRPKKDSRWRRLNSSDSYENDYDEELAEGAFRQMFEQFISAYERLLLTVRRENPAFQNKINIFTLLKSYPGQFGMSNPRIQAQAGGFILAGLDHRYINDQMLSTRGTGSSGFQFSFPRIIITNKKEIYRQLQMLNITDATMLPDLTHKANYLDNQIQ